MNTSTTSSMLFHMGGVPVGSYDGIPVPFYGSQGVWFVDHSHGSDSYDGKSLEGAKATIQDAVDESEPGDTILVMAGELAQTDTDPNSYTENVVVDTPQLTIRGVSRGRTQGGLPQLKVGTTTTQAILTVRAPGCQIINIGINGAGATGGGILLTDDGGATYCALGTSILGCHFKNCVGGTATNAATGGAIQWGSAGNAWQVLIAGNKFYKNVGDIVLLGTGGSVPQDVQIEWNTFSGPAANVDCNLYLKGGSGMNGVVIDHNIFPCWPALSSGTNVMPVSLTGCVGILSNNVFGCTGKTFGAAGNALVPTTVLMANNYQEDGTTQIART